MGIINILDPKTVSLISAGEVVERPASVIKELMENAIDAGAGSITVEIKAGGSAYMRVSDDGKGMSGEDVLQCVKKHATSKIKNPDDLDNILTLGFRGEALAAISSVSKFEIVSKRREDIIGTRMTIEGDGQPKTEETGCPAGTTVTVCDLFFNLPARRKFLKKPATETGAVSQYVEKIALSHPEIAFKYIADGSVKLQTSGDNSLANAVYAVYGREFASGIIPVMFEQNGIEITGYIAKPELSKTGRNYQTCFVNNRYVRAKSVLFAVDDAYKNFILSEKYACYVIFCKIDPHAIDVNVHPAKLEIKFSDEKAVYSAVYTAVRTALQNLKNPLAQPQREQDEPVPEKPAQAEQKPEHKPYIPHQQPEKAGAKLDMKDFSEIFKVEEYKPSGNVEQVSAEFKSATPVGVLRTVYRPQPQNDEQKIHTVKTDAIQQPSQEAVPKTLPETDQENKIDGTRQQYRVVGEVFNTYVVVESGDGMVLIDKHAAHERILYEQFKSIKGDASRQLLMVPAVVETDRKTAQYADEFIPQMRDIGFDIDTFGDNAFIVRSVPQLMSGASSEEISDAVSEIAQNVADGKRASLPLEVIQDNILHTAACKAAIKAKRHYDISDIEYLVKRLYEIGNITYCPHGRPVCKIFTKKELDKLFFRT